MQFSMMDYGFGAGMIIFMLLFWLLIIAGLVLFIKFLWEGSGGKKAQESALNVLKKRYARGEISKEEFEEKKRELS